MLSSLNKDKTKRGQQVVVLVQVLAHEINTGYKYSVVPVESFNGVKVGLESGLTSFVAACRSGFLHLPLVMTFASLFSHTLT